MQLNVIKQYTTYHSSFLSCTFLKALPLLPEWPICHMLANNRSSDDNVGRTDVYFLNKVTSMEKNEDLVSVVPFMYISTWPLWTHISFVYYFPSRRAVPIRLQDFDCLVWTKGKNCRQFCNNKLSCWVVICGKEYCGILLLGKMVKFMAVCFDVRQPESSSI